MIQVHAEAKHVNKNIEHFHSVMMVTKQFQNNAIMTDFSAD